MHTAFDLYRAAPGYAISRRAPSNLTGACTGRSPDFQNRRARVKRSSHWLEFSLKAPVESAKNRFSFDDRGTRQSDASRQFLVVGRQFSYIQRHRMPQMYRPMSVGRFRRAEDILGLSRVGRSACVCSPPKPLWVPLPATLEYL
jgi:hypothetical protein